MNLHIVSGHLGKDPEMNYTPSGLAVTKFSVATTYNKKNAQGEWEKETTWHNLVTFGKTAENCNSYLRKGSKIAARGRLTHRKYTDKSGVERVWTETVVDEIDFPAKSSDTSDFVPPIPDFDYDNPF